MSSTERPGPQPVVHIERANGTIDEIRSLRGAPVVPIIQGGALRVPTAGGEVGYSLFHVASWSVTYENEKER